MYEILTDSVPYPELKWGELPDHEFKTKVINECYHPKFNVPIKKSLRQLIEKCWSNDPVNRHSFREILANIKKEEDADADDYMIEDVDHDEFDLYVDLIEQLLDQVETIEKDKKQLKMKITKLEDENKQKSKKISMIEKENQQLKEEIDKLKRFKTISSPKLPKSSRKTNFLDICFVIDVPNSMRDSFPAIIDLIHDSCFNLSISNRKSFIRFGCVVLRDPESRPINEKHRNVIKILLKNVGLRILKIDQLSMKF